MTKPSRSSLWAPLISLLCACHLASCTGSSPAQPAPHEKPISPAVAQQTAASERNVEAKTQPENSVNNKSQGATETATFGAGCFWCIEAVLQRIDGVIKIESGYMGGLATQPTYDNVCSGTTGHAEVVRVQFDPAKLPYEKLCDWFSWPMIQPRKTARATTRARSIARWSSTIPMRSKGRARGDGTGKVTLVSADRHRVYCCDDVLARRGLPPELLQQQPDQLILPSVDPPKLKKLGLDSPPK